MKKIMIIILMVMSSLICMAQAKIEYKVINVQCVFATVGTIASIYRVSIDNENNTTIAVADPNKKNRYKFYDSTLGAIKQYLDKGWTIHTLCINSNTYVYLLERKIKQVNNENKL